MSPHEASVRSPAPPAARRIALGVTTVTNVEVTAGDRPDSGASTATGAPSPAQLAVMVGALVVGVALRAVGLGSTVPTFDESFSGVAAQRSLPSLLDHLAHADTHPPLDYLVRMPVAATGDVALLRAPSVVMGIATLAVVAWWMWRRRWFGVTVVALTAVAPLQVLHDRQARMYAAAVLAGTVVAAAAHRWSESPAPRWSVMAAIGVLVALFSHITSLLLVLGLFALAGRRRDRPAWELRAAAAGPVLVWLVLWGPSVRHQLAGDPASWIPLTTPRSAVDAIGGQLSLFEATAAIAVVAIVAGGIVLARTDPVLGRVWWCLYALPTAGLALVGLQAHVLLPRSLSIIGWGPVVAVAALVAPALRAPSPVVRLGVPVAVAALVLPSTVEVLRFEELSAPVRDRLGEVVAPGDAVGVHPAFLAPMVQWDLELGPEPPTVDGFDGDAVDVWASPVAGALRPGGRLWLVVPESYGTPPVDLPTCAGVDIRPGGDLTLRCYELG